MGKLVESTQWEEDLYQLEIADPVEGGPDGVSNKQAKQLGGRTRYLKTQLDQSQSSLAQHMAAVDPHSQYALKTDLAAKLAALVGQSPQSLDTLKELADALGNDPNFATTILNALALKAAIDSQTFTGAPKSTTPPQFDSSTRLATTAFVQSALGNYAGAIVVNAASTLTKVAAGQIVELNGSSTFSTILPLSATVAVGGRMAFINQSGVDQNIVTQGIENVWSYLGGLVSSVVLRSGDSLELISRGGQWDISGGTAALRYVQGATTQTPQQFDNSAKLATTAFVQRALGNFQNFYSYQTSQVLIGAQSGAVINFWGTSAATFTLPAASAMPTCGALYFVNSGSAALTVSRAGSDAVVGSGGSANMVLNPGDSLLLVTTNGANQWIVIGGSAQLPYSSVMSGANFATAPQFDSSTKLATTAFVQRALGSYSGFSLVTASSTLTAAAAGQLVELNGNSIFTTTLPVGASVVQGGKMAFVNQSNANQTIAVQSSDSIWSYAGGLASSISLRPGDSLELVSRAGQWDICGGSVLLQFSSSFGSQLGTSGYQKLPSGLIIQWGTFITNSSGTQTVTLPLAFPSAQLGAVASVTAANTTATVATGSATKSSLTIGTRDFVGNSGISASGIYFAWGY
ncbi:hypothetical protein OHZ10_28035 [Burkholderia arboris]|uniref:Putative tail fiber protein gp53-like C-terminal domain-containing protein n=1 Tax=Burkholderia arboris TaxID=488730 RepID=A0ABZ3DNR0_9BURK